MSKTLLLSAFLVLFAFADMYGGAPNPATVNHDAISTEGLSAKQLRQKRKTDKRMERFEKKVTHKLQKKKAKSSPEGLRDLDKNLRLAIIFAIIAVGLSILGAFTGVLWILASLAWLAALIFLVIWLIEDA